MIPLEYLIALASILFAIGAAGVILRKNMIVMLMCVELMLNAVNLLFVSFSRELGSMDGHIFTFMIMAVAGGEAAVGLAIIISLVRSGRSVSADDINLLKG